MFSRILPIITIHLIFWGMILFTFLVSDHEVHHAIGSRIVFIMIPTYLGGIFGENWGKRGVLIGAGIVGFLPLAVLPASRTTLEVILTLACWCYSIWFVMVHRLPRIKG